MMRVLAMAAALWAALAGAALALQPEELLPDPALEERAREISRGLRCVVCQNQSIDESDAGVAQDMRRQVREWLVEGHTDDQIRSKMVSFYGEYVLMTPPFSLQNAVIWLGPVAALGLAGFWGLRRVGYLGGAASGASAAPAAGPPDAPAAAPLSDDEKARLDAIMKHGD